MESFLTQLNSSILSSTVFILVLALWIIPWKGIALWRAARNSQKCWFIALLVLNTLSILEIIYVFFFSKKREIIENK